MAEPTSIGDVIDLYGDHHGDICAIERSQVHQYRDKVRIDYAKTSAAMILTLIILPFGAL